MWLVRRRRRGGGREECEIMTKGRFQVCAWDVHCVGLLGVRLDARSRCKSDRTGEL